MTDRGSPGCGRCAETRRPSHSSCVGGTDGGLLMARSYTHTRARTYARGQTPCICPPSMSQVPLPLSHFAFTVLAQRLQDGQEQNLRKMRTSAALRCFERVCVSCKECVSTLHQSAVTLRKRGKHESVLCNCTFFKASWGEGGGGGGGVSGALGGGRVQTSVR